MSDSYSACNIVKEYSNVRVLHGVDFKIEAGTIHGLFGHNGAGKSTLLKIMAGVEPQNEGELNLFGESLRLNSPKDALLKGIACVYQELRLISELTVMQNIFLGREFASKLGVKDEKSMLQYTEKLLNEYKLNVNPKAYIKDLTHPLKQMIEVVANLDRNAKFIFLDEPTTAIESKQADILLNDVRRIVMEKQIGVAIVSHKIDEVLKYCDEVSIMSGGKMVLNKLKGDFSKQDIIDAIVGERKHSASFSLENIKTMKGQLKNEKTEDAEIKNEHGAKEYNSERKPMLEVNNMCTVKLHNINLKAYEGEILGIYGLVGSGRTSFCHTLYGLHGNIEEGNILLDGREYIPKNPKHAMESGIAYLTEERKRFGIIPLMPAITNAALTSLKRFSNFCYLDEHAYQSKLINTLEDMQIKGNIYGAIKSLSGGNQQKVLIARIIEEKSKLILLDEPTKGVDLSAKADIYNIIRSLSKAGNCIIIVSSEEEELVEIADNVVVFNAGRCKEKMIKGSDITVTNLRESVF